MTMNRQHASPILILADESPVAVPEGSRVFDDEPSVGEPASDALELSHAAARKVF